MLPRELTSGSGQNESAPATRNDADLSIEAKENTLTIRGEKQTNDEETTGELLYRGIAARNFERNFQLADHVEVIAPARRSARCVSRSPMLSPSASQHKREDGAFSRSDFTFDKE
jgi:hypothetical protein